MSHRRALLPAVLAAGLLVAAGPGGAAVSAGAAPPGRARVAASTPVPTPLLARVSAHGLATPTTAQCEAVLHLACYGPAQLRAAYNLNPLYASHLTGSGVTIAIVDAFAAPQVAGDLATFDAGFGLPNPPSLRVIAPAGALPAFTVHNAAMVNWAMETDLDVEWAHALAPGASILLVQTPVDEVEGLGGFPQIVAAENYVVAHHLADVITQSFGATEQSFSSPATLLSLRSAYLAADAAGVSVLAASGDSGATNFTGTGSTYSLSRAVAWPASDPLVTAVGGLQYSLSASGSTVAPLAVWNDTASLGHPASAGGGPSVVFPRPWYQDDVAAQVGAARGVPDVSLSAAVNGAALTYLGPDASANRPGYYLIGGTSEASPSFAAVVAIADQLAGHSLGLLNPALYLLEDEHAPGLVDVTRGTNTVSFTQSGARHTVVGWNAVPGYDLASGVGGINAAQLVPELVATVGDGPSTRPGPPRS